MSKACFLFLFLISLAKVSSSQELNNFRTKLLFVTGDTIKLDSLSIIPASEIVQLQSKTLDNSTYNIDYSKSLLFANKSIIGNELKISYRVFPINFTKKYYHKSLSQIEQEDPGKYDYFTLKEEERNVDFFKTSALQKNGSISRGFNFGNNQDLSVNSNLDLQLSGKLGNNINIEAAISDENLPIQAEGNTQQLQEFDRVYIQLYNEKSKLIAGDFRISRPKGYFMNFNKKVQGAGISTLMETHKQQKKSERGELKTAVNAAISRGKFARNVIVGVEGNQGPYQLQGEEGESFIIVLSGTERVYVNGKLMRRGQENDYIIDYNTAELSFTPQQIITKDHRIVVEFQYSDRNYGRSVVFVENQYKKKKLELGFNIYSEQDHKNQPLQQELSEEEKLALSLAGDDPNLAVVSGIDSSRFEEDLVLYEQIDSLGYAGILKYSKNKDSSLFKAKFSLVGENKGNYIQIQSDANGRVFQWVAPANGIPQGRYEPILQLVTPKKRQMLTLGGTYSFNKKSSLKVEGAMSRLDLNTFSDKNNSDNTSYGLLTHFQSESVLNTKDSLGKTRWKNDIFYEQRGRNFSHIERYRNVEFDRDWNIRGLALEGNEYLLKAKTGISKKKSKINYVFSSFNKGTSYQGIRNGLEGVFVKKGFTASSRASFMNAKATNNNRFLRHYTTISQKLGKIRVGTYLEQEQVIFYKGKTDSIQNNSFDRVIWKAFVEKGDSSANKNFRLSYSEIFDRLADTTKLSVAQKSRNFDFDFRLEANPRNRLSGKITYRELKITNKELSSRNNENTILGRLNYDSKIVKGLINSSTYYQIGSGLENKREFSFLKVSDGQGTHLWNDYNSNGIQELNEFEVAGSNNSFQANFIKIYTPTSNFIRVFNNQFNQLLFIKPNAIIKSKVGFNKWLGKLSTKTMYRAERKTLAENDIYNPFHTAASDTNLITVNSSLSNTLYFNRLNSKFGVDYFYLNSKSKSLLTNGFDSRSQEIQEIRARFNWKKVYTLESKVGSSVKESGSEFFDSRNFRIQAYKIEPSISYQPSTKFRLTVLLNYTEKENKLNGKEKSINQTASTELLFSEAGKGTFSLKVDYVKIAFDESASSSLSFEMLEGLQVGNNLSWTINWQRNLTKTLQLSLNYIGRKSEELRTIHSGGMQLRAFF